MKPMKTKVAPYMSAFSGPPTLHCPEIVGCSPDKPFLYKIPVTGEATLFYLCILPDSLTLDNKSGIITGIVGKGEYTLEIKVKNNLGEDSCTIRLICAEDNARLTPLLGWTS